jgi:hypothetical protein
MALFMQMATAMMAGQLGGMQMPGFPMQMFSQAPSQPQPQPQPVLHQPSQPQPHHHQGTGSLFMFRCPQCKTPWKRRMQTGQHPLLNCRNCHCQVVGTQCQGALAGPFHGGSNPPSSSSSHSGAAAGAPAPPPIPHSHSHSHTGPRIAYEKLPVETVQLLHAPLQRATNEWAHQTTDDLDASMAAAPGTGTHAAALPSSTSSTIPPVPVKHVRFSNPLVEFDEAPTPRLSAPQKRVKTSASHLSNAVHGGSSSSSSSSGGESESEDVEGTLLQPQVQLERKAWGAAAGKRKAAKTKAPANNGSSKGLKSCAMKSEAATTPKQAPTAHGTATSVPLSKLRYARVAALSLFSGGGGTGTDARGKKR